jgi:hypothetical protein
MPLISRRDPFWPELPAPTWSRACWLVATLLSRGIRSLEATLLSRGLEKLTAAIVVAVVLAEVVPLALAGVSVSHAWVLISEGSRCDDSV